MNNHGYYTSGSFTQRKKRLFGTAEGLTCEKVNCLALYKNGTLFAGTAEGLCKLDGEGFVPVFKDVLSKNIAALTVLCDGSLAVCSENELYILKEDTLKLLRTFESDLVGVCDSRDLLWVLTQERFICTSYDGKTDSVNRPLEGGEGKSLAVNGKEIYVATETNISVIHGKRKEWKNILPDFSYMPVLPVNHLCFDEAGYLWLGTKEGAAIHDNKSLWLTAEKIHTLPKNEVYKIAADEVGGRYFASDVGVIYQKNGALKYFSAERYMPECKVNDVAAAADGSVFYAATDKGISEISSYETTLAKKAEAFEEINEKYHTRLGFTANRVSVDNHDISTGRVGISDNDGLWTAMYVAAESFRYGATKDEEALRRARRGMNAMLLLTRATELDGFTARAVRYPGDEGFGNGDHEWALSSDGSYEWKGETSSDEMTGHFFGFSVYYDLCADKKEKEDIRKALCAITDHIVRNGYRLIDRDGLPTTWACWDPELLNYDDKWFFERGINSLELLMFLKVSYHISGDEKYRALYDDFVSKHHYPLNAMQHKIRDAHICHIDDNLGFLAVLALLRLEENEALRSYYLCGMEDHWQYEKIEKQPMFCFIHAAFTGRDDDIGEGIQSLREIPLDLTYYAMYNSKRKDIVYDTEQEAWHEEPQVKYPLPFDERNVKRPDSGTFQLDCGDRRYAQEGTVFLLPYWIARFYGLIKEADN